MKLPKYLTTVTSLSKILAAVLFITLPFVGFYLGMQYQQVLNQAKESQLISNAPINHPIPTPSISVLPTTDPSIIANWKTYAKASKLISYSLMYPSNWTYEEANGGTKFFPPLNTNKNSNISLYVSNAPPPPCMSKTTTIRKVRSISGEEVLVQRGLCYLSGEYAAEIYHLGYWARFVFSTSLDRKYDSFFDQILSTFKFTE